MKIFEKRKTFLLSTFTKELRLFNYPVWAEKKTPFYRQVKVFKSFTLFKVPHRNYPFYDNNFKSFEQFSNDFVQEIKSHSKPIILWIDHSLQGGTEVYSQDQFKILCTEYTIIRVQYYLLQEAYGYCKGSL